MGFLGFGKKEKPDMPRVEEKFEDNKDNMENKPEMEQEDMDKDKESE